MSPFDATIYGPGFHFESPLDKFPTNPLGPGQPHRPLRAALEAMTVESAFAGTTIVDGDAAHACLAGVWLRYDFLHESHQISQAIETPIGSYWHGILHRREPDYGNAKYWFRQVGKHPVFEPLWEAAQEIAAAYAFDEGRSLHAWNRWDPFGFVDLCQAAAEDKGKFQLFCREIALREWELLFDYSYRVAVGKLE
ncbi:MAG: hypothetical protein SGJ19_13345 [Planctomycetia bacterium]|nr:hypothetical protein [Planctomycetia bacterium]